MLRSLLITLSKAAWAQRMVTHWRFARRMALRFIAGETLAEALEVVRQLNAKGVVATVDHLGENTTSANDSIRASDEVIEILEAIVRNKLRANVSVKLSQIGLVIDENLCRENLRRILERAREQQNFIRIDMEDSSLTEKTVGAYLWARQQGFDNTGIVIQSYLYRSRKDINEMAEFDTRVRLCKGAYKEPPSAAFPKKAQVDANYDDLTRLLIEESRKLGFPKISADGRRPPIPGIATHDAQRVEFAKRLAAEFKMPNEALEFQMLYGIRRDLQERLVQQGYPVRIYVPFGTRWYPYFMRRLAERPSNLWFFVSNFFRR